MDTTETNWTPRVVNAWTEAIDISKTKGHSICNTYHLFQSLWNNTNSSFLGFIHQRGLKIDRDIINDIVNKYAKKRSDLFSQEKADHVESLIRKCVVSATAVAQYEKHIYLGVEHFIWGIIDTDESFCEFLLENEIDTEYLKESIVLFFSGATQKMMNAEGRDAFAFIDDDEDEEEYLALQGPQIDRFCVLLNDVVSKPNFGVISGRDKEISHIEEILCCKVKSNAILVGEAGGGKTSVVEGLAQVINDPDYSGPLKDKKIYSLDLGLLVAGSKYRGQLEERFAKLISEFKQDSDKIIFIDEIHSIIGVGGKDGSADIANLLKPELARGEIKCIGATTSTEYKKYFEKDAALSRRFHVVYVDPPNLDQMKSIARKSIKAYEKHHKVKFPLKTLDLAIEMSDAYISHKKFIDKAFDVIDRSMAKAQMRKSKKVDIQDVAAVVSQISGINQDILIKNLDKQFSDIEINLKNQIIGQNDAVQKIYDTLACAKAGLTSNQKPLASFLFVGPTSVGKTFAAKKIAEEYFGNQRSFLQLNMSEYQEQSSISRLIGASAGYVGFEEGGILTEFVRSNPNSVILFDEIEKSNPSVLNLLLQILDEAEIKDNLNRKINFSGSIVVMTSNLGASAKPKTSMGFVNCTESVVDSHLNAVSASLSPELLARIDEVIIFNKLNKDSLRIIFNKLASNLTQECSFKKINLSVNVEISDINKNYESLHARDVKSLFRNRIQTPIAKFIAKNPQAKKISVSIQNQEITLS
jgi:ATP-dependent Clp protease ATP-binding subunit ClpA